MPFDEREPHWQASEEDLRRYIAGVLERQRNRRGFSPVESGNLQELVDRKFLGIDGFKYCEVEHAQWAARHAW